MFPQWLVSADRAASSVEGDNYKATWVCFCMRLASCQLDCVDVSVCVCACGEYVGDG